MRLKIKQLFSKKNIKKLLRSSLCLLLSVLTVVCFGGVLAPTQAHAVAGVDDAIYFIVAFLICCGMTFASTSAATNAAQQFYAQAPPSVQEIIDYQAEQLQKDTALPFGVLAILKSDWKALIDEFMAQFPQYCNIDLDYSSAVKNQLTEDTLFKSLVAGTTVSISSPWTLDTNIFIQTSANTTLSFYGMDTLSKVFGSDLYNQISNFNSSFKNMNNTQFAVFNVPALDFTVISIIGFNVSTGGPVIGKLTYRNDYSDVYVNNFPVSGIGSFSIALYKNEICNYNFDSSSRSFTLTAPSYGNIVSRWIADDVISRNDNLINCDDLCLPINKIGQLLLGEDVFDVGIDSAHIPGIDSFPSTAGDITDVSTYPDSIGISVPRDLSDTITKTAEDIRTVDKDKTDTDDKTDTKPGESKPNKPSIPGLSLPEILFKEKFPFCLPWDIFNVFANLVAEPEAPVFEIPMKWEFLDIDYTLTIDFSMFDEIAKISRFFSSLGFVVFLILISRKVIGAE